MKKVSVVVCALVVGVLLLSVAAPAFAAKKTHDMKATVVSINLEKKLLTIEDEAGETMTAAVIDKAVDSLKTLKAGDHVTLTCQDSEAGEHEGVSQIKVAKS